MIRIIAATLSLIASTTPALAGSIRPEMVIQFKDGAIACLSREGLTKIMSHGFKGEATKMRAMMIDQGGECLMVPPTKRVKVISAEYNDPNIDIGILEIVGEDKTILNGAWALSLSAEEVTTRRPRKR